MVIDSGGRLSDLTAMTSATKPPAACLIGWPAAHSRSPLIHHYWLRTLGIAGGYVIEAVPPDDLRDFVLRLSLRGFELWFEDGELHATNTDVEGFINNLDASAPGWDAAEEALVLGAGGSARAVVFGLRERGIKRIHLANRTIARAETLAKEFGPNVQPVTWDGINDVLPRAKLLVNTTSLGMHGQPSLDVDVARLPEGTVVADLVYVPLVTPLLAAAKARGLKTADGLGMLLHQAVRGFELWFGRRPRVTAELRALVEADLTKS